MSDLRGREARLQLHSLLRFQPLESRLLRPIISSLEMLCADELHHFDALLPRTSPWLNLMLQIILNDNLIILRSLDDARID